LASEGTVRRTSVLLLAVYVPNVPASIGLPAGLFFANRSQRARTVTGGRRQRRA